MTKKCGTCNARDEKRETIEIRTVIGMITISICHCALSLSLSQCQTNAKTCSKVTEKKH